MQRTAIALTLALCALPVCGQTLREVLRKVGIPANQFTATELAQQVQATFGKEAALTYLVYLPPDPNGIEPNAPRLVRYDNATKAMLRHNLKPEEMENCCGSPLDIQFTRSYVLVSFSDTPSAETVLAVDKDLKYRGTLYGFGFKEIAPDQVVFVEDEVHFAAQHPERLAWADLKNGREMELYPPKSDALRAGFARLNQKHMPPKADCEKADDPCDPAIYDEDIEFVSGDGHGGFKIRVTSEGGHPWITKDAIVDIPFQRAVYEYQESGKGWRYCAIEDTLTGLIKSIDEPPPPSQPKSCVPSLPVVPDQSGLGNPFAPHTGKAN